MLSTVNGRSSRQRASVKRSRSLSNALTAVGGILHWEGDADDTLVGPDVDSIWQIIGADSGIQNGQIRNRDTFVVQAGGGLSGLLDGGPGGFDTLVLDGGIVDTVRDGPAGTDAVTLDSIMNLGSADPILMGEEILVANSAQITTAGPGDVTLPATAEDLVEDLSGLSVADFAIEIPGSLAWYATVQRQGPVCNTRRVPVPFPVSRISR